VIHGLLPGGKPTVRAQCTQWRCIAIGRPRCSAKVHDSVTAAPGKPSCRGKTCPQLAPYLLHQQVSLALGQDGHRRLEQDGVAVLLHWGGWHSGSCQTRVALGMSATGGLGHASHCQPLPNMAGLLQRWLAQRTCVATAWRWHMTRVPARSPANRADRGWNPEQSTAGWLLACSMTSMSRQAKPTGKGQE
jgi:hypothetical protein